MARTDAIKNRFFKMLIPTGSLEDAFPGSYPISGRVHYSKRGGSLLRRTTPERVPSIRLTRPGFVQRQCCRIFGLAALTGRIYARLYKDADFPGWAVPS